MIGIWNPSSIAKIPESISWKFLESEVWNPDSKTVLDSLTQADWLLVFQISFFKTIGLSKQYLLTTPGTWESSRTDKLAPYKTK